MTNFQKLLELCINPPMNVYNGAMEKDSFVTFILALLYLHEEERMM